MITAGVDVGAKNVKVVIQDEGKILGKGLVLAGLGRGQEAVSEARWLQNSIVYREDANQGRHVADERARIQRRPLR